VEKNVRKEYYLKPFYKMAYTLNGLLLCLIVFLKWQNLLFPWLPQWPWTILVIFYAIFAVVLLYNAIFEKLIISETGIEHLSFLQHQFLSWDDVESIPIQFKFKLLFAKSSKNIKRPGISLYLFVNNLTDSDLGRQIKQYAPHLFEI
jgi:hypothetical protein